MLPVKVAGHHRGLGSDGHCRQWVGEREEGGPPRSQPGPRPSSLAPPGEGDSPRPPVGFQLCWQGRQRMGVLGILDLASDTGL